MQKLTGRISYWNDQKKFGFIEQRTPAEVGTGFILKQYYLQASEIQHIPDTVRVGYITRFLPDPRPLRFENAKPAAINVEIYSSEDEMNAVGVK